jgi:hypothetical protein
MMNDASLHLGGAMVEGWEQRWDQKWFKVEGGLTFHQTSLNSVVGVYRFSYGGKVVVIGNATARTGGLAKRLSDFRRDSDNARRTYAGRLSYQHRAQIVVEVLITGNDQDARVTASLLKDWMIQRHKPLWTSTYGISKRKR